MKKRVIGLCLVMVLSFSSCAVEQEVAVKPTALSTATPTIVPTIAPTEVPTEIPTATPTLETTLKPTPTPKQQPPLLQQMLTKEGLSFETLPCKQLVLVVAEGTTCTLYTYEREEDGFWKKVLSVQGYVGKKGLTNDHKEGNGTTPAGFYKLGFAFGHDANPTGNYPYRQITEGSYWVDDPASQYYNQWVTQDQEKDWNSAEDLWKIKTEYALAVLIEYNYGANTVPGKGSAIFLHVGSKPTAGCVAISKTNMKALLGWLEEDATPYILIL